MSDSDYCGGSFRKYEGMSLLLSAVCDNLFVKDDDRGNGIRDEILQKPQTATIDKLLQLLSSSYYIIERNYIDRDFIEDYAYYYARCFKQYPRKCCRVHFFGKGADAGQINEILCGVFSNKWEERLNKVQQSYLGFIVFRPLPSTVYAKVCLRPAVFDDSSLAISDIDVHLLGAKLKVKTIPFQEQDSVVAACATSALWSAFQITGRKWMHCIPSPHRITRLATEGGACESRPFPSKGLTIGDVGRAIFKMGLSQQTLSTKEQEIFRAEVYAYLKMGVPLIMCGKIRAPGKKIDSDDWHAVTVAGFGMPTKAQSVLCGGVFLRGASVTTLYCNDDRLGPFFAFTGDPKNQDEDNKDGKAIKLKTYEKKRVLGSDCMEGIDSERFTVKYVMAPVYHKLRIGFADVFDALALLNQELLKCLEDGKTAASLSIQRLTWDLYLSASVDVKCWVRNPELGLDVGVVAAICCSPMPKYVWVASALENDRRLGTFLVDATGIAQDLDVFDFIDGDDGFKSLLYCVAESVLKPSNEDVVIGDPDERERESEAKRRYQLMAMRNPFMRSLFHMMRNGKR